MQESQNTHGDSGTKLLARSAFVRSPWRSLLLAALLFLAIAVVGSIGMGELLSRPAHSRIGSAPSEWGAVDVALAMADGKRVFGWYVETKSPKGAVLLLHGVRSNRRQMKDRVPFLRALGYSVMLIDLPSHGESDGDRITFGAHEAEGADAALTDLRQRAPGLPVGVIGASMGAASLVLAHLRQPPDAVVLESMYPTIEDATDDRMRNALGSLGPWLSPLLLVQLPLRTGVSVGDLRPIDAIKRLRCPIFILNGSEDRNTTPSEAKRLFETATPPKRLWIVPGAGHVDLHAFAGTEYESRVGSFFAAHLDHPDGGGR